MKRIAAISFGICIVSAMLGLWGCRRTSTTQAEGRPDLKIELETLYARYVQAMRTENGNMLASVLTTAEITRVKEGFQRMSMSFPKDYFDLQKSRTARLPTLSETRHLGITQDGPCVNLVYVENMTESKRQACLPQQFYIVRFEKERDGWKYVGLADPPTLIAPDWEKQVADGQLKFLESKPFKPEHVKQVGP